MTTLVLLLSMSYVLIAVSQPLSELEHLNLGYNCLQRAPTLGLSARAKLLTLNLRNNELETINGKVDWRRQSQNFLSWPLNTDNQSLSDQTERWANPFTELREEWVKQMENRKLNTRQTHKDAQICYELDFPRQTEVLFFFDIVYHHSVK